MKLTILAFALSTLAFTASPAAPTHRTLTPRPSFVPPPCFPGCTGKCLSPDGPTQCGGQKPA